MNAERAGVTPAEVRERVLASRRYRGLAGELIERIAAEEIPKARGLAEAEKRTKRRLHQIFGAYTPLAPADYARLLISLRAAVAAGDEAAIRRACAEAMAMHASTRERLPYLERFYTEIFALTGPPATLLDVGCGLNPLAAPWMGLPPGARYHACDIDRAMLDFVGAALQTLGIGHHTAICDVIAAPPHVPPGCDVALLLKTAPCLEQQRAGITAELLRALPARHIVVSYPTRSLGGHGKGMPRTYRAHFQAAMDAIPRSFTEFEFPGELVYVVLSAE